MATNDAGPHDDKLTIISIAVLGYMVQDVLHEGLGHGVTAWLSGAHQLTMSTVALQSDISTRWISASGTLVNLVAGALLWAWLRSRPLRPATRYFLIIAMAGNLFTGTGYFLFSGVANFGDWAAVIRGWQPQWAWRVGLILLGAATYFGSMLLVARELRPFHVGELATQRIRRITWTPYFTQGVLATVAGVLNPAGLFYVIASALPSTMGANAGMLNLADIVRGWGRGTEEPVATIGRSKGWIVAGAVGAAIFIFVLGRGVTFGR